MAFSYTPSDGLNNTSSYKTAPDTEALARSQFMDLFNQVKDYLNNNINTASAIANGSATIHIEDLNIDLIIQWGTYTTPSGQTTLSTSGSPVTYFVSVPNITLPKPFQSACLYTDANVLGVAALWANSKENAANPKTQIDLTISGVSNYGAYFQNTTVRWFAVGF